MTLGICRPGSQASNSQREESTPASIWQALAGIPITDELLEWPADLFALTNVILERSEAFRFVLSPPCGVEWPPPRFPSWSDAVEETGRQWSIWVEDRKSAFPDLLTEEWSAFRGRAGMLLALRHQLLVLHVRAVGVGCVSVGLTVSCGSGFRDCGTIGARHCSWSSRRLSSPGIARGFDCIGIARVAILKDDRVYLQKFGI